MKPKKTKLLMTKTFNGRKFEVYLDKNYQLDLSEKSMYGKLIESGHLNVYGVVGRSTKGKNCESNIWNIIEDSPESALIDYFLQMGCSSKELKEMGVTE